MKLQPTEERRFSAPRFAVIERRPPGAGAILLAIVVAVGALYFITYAVSHIRRVALNMQGAGGGGSGSGAAGSSEGADDDDDPNQIDTIVLGDPADAPVPGRRGNHVSPVHPTIVVRLPRYGDQVGKIPDTPAGHLLWEWLAAFNQGSVSGLADVLPNAATPAAAAAQMELRRQTGGFNLLSAKEVEPGVLVFRLSDQTPLGNEFLGTLWVNSESIPAVVGSFSLEAVGVGGVGAKGDRE
jgi:hypothetical protein